MGARDGEMRVKFVRATQQMKIPQNASVFMILMPNATSHVTPTGDTKSSTGGGRGSSTNMGDSTKTNRKRLRLAVNNTKLSDREEVIRGI